MDIRTLLSAQGIDTDSLSDDQLAVYHTLFRRRDVRREFAGEVVDRSLSKHGVVLELRTAEGRGVARDQDELGCGGRTVVSVS